MRRESSILFERAENPRAKANFLSGLFFCYTWKTFLEGRRRDLNEGDLTQPLQEHRSDLLGEEMAIAWSAEVDKAKKYNRKPSLNKVILKVFYMDIIIYGIILLIMEMVLRLSQPLFVGLYIRYFSIENRNSEEPLHYPMWFWRVLNFWTPGQSPVQRDEAWFFGFGIVFCSICVNCTIHPYMLAVLHVGMRIRVGCCSLMYRKALRIKLTALGGETVGNIVNLMSNDVNRFDMAPIFIHYLWLAPLQAIFCVYFMYREMGDAAFYGILALIIVVPLQVFLGFASSRFRASAAIKTDDRIRQMNEIIQAMQVIKMYAWENAFADLIHKKRKDEIKIIQFTAYIRGLIMSFIMFTARTGIFLTIMSYVLDDNTITAQNVFMIASYYMIIRQTMTVYFPQGVAMVAEASVSIDRIQHFMMTEESAIGDPTVLDPHFEEDGKVRENEDLNQPLYPDDVAKVSIVHGMAKYAEEVCLEDVNVEMDPGTLTAVVGPVGSGKSCLLKLILGELQMFSGQMIVKGVISYASQEPWLFAGSVRQNILFGRDYEAGRYGEVVKVCALVRDFVLLPYGDRTIIGERGISLSGGQRARVNLARAVYKDADIYLLDDPLSAVDIQVGLQLFEECLLKYLKNKIVILVTHQLQYLKKATQIMIFHDGIMGLCASYNSLLDSGLGFANLIEEAVGLAATVEDSRDPNVKVLRYVSRTSARVNAMIDVEGTKVGPTVEPEMRTLGAVDWVNYRDYFLAGANCCFLFILVILFLGAQFLGSIGDFFLGQWVELEEARVGLGTAEHKGFWNQFTRDDCISIYTLIIILTIVVAIVRSVYFFTVCMRASVRLHDRMFASIIRGTMRFFNTNTSGRILNRFSKDLGAVDELLPNAFIDTTQLMLNLCGAVIVVGVVNYYLLIPVFLMVIAFYFLRDFYLRTSRSVKRLEGITKSPVFGHLNATLQGLPSIRSNGAEQILTQEFDALQDIHSSAWYMFLFTSRAFGFWCDLVCTVFIGTVTISFIVFEKAYDAGSVGLAITQCIGLSGLIQWGLRQSAELENQMTSVERIFEFTRIEHEFALDSSPDKKPSASWPRQGRVEFINVYMRYSPTEDPVLKNLNFVVYPEEKIGIVGRTGAGKSSLIVTLFRLSYFEGSLLVDNLDIKILGLHDLRKKISIIPQEPVLFNGTLRYNLDPFGQYKDDEIVAALVDVEIRTAVVNGKACLDDVVTEGGTNISVGQRQMICLARAILRNNRILVLDEATANVDALTDKLIQKTIRTKFDHCTVLTIAHRLHTVMDSDRVLVMDAGIPVQFNHPHVLLQDKTGQFFDMVKKTGPGMADTLTRIAKESYQSRKGNFKHEKKNKPQASTGPKK